MKRYVIINQDATLIYGGKLYDDEAWAKHEMDKLMCSDNWVVIPITIRTKITKGTISRFVGKGK